MPLGLGLGIGSSRRRGWKSASIPGIIDHFPFDESAPPFASLTRTNLASAVGAVTATPGVSGNAARIDAAGGKYLSLAISPLAGLSSFLILCRVRITSDAQDAAQWGRLISTGDGTGNEITCIANSDARTGFGVAVVHPGPYGGSDEVRTFKGYGDVLNTWVHGGWLVSDAAGVYAIMSEGLCVAGGAKPPAAVAAIADQHLCFLGKSITAGTQFGGDLDDFAAFSLDGANKLSPWEYLSLLRGSGGAYPRPNPAPYLYLSFGPGQTAGESLRLLDTADGTTLRDLPVCCVLPTVGGVQTTIRDPRAFRLPGDPYLYAVYTSGGLANNYTKFGVIRSRNFFFWEHVAEVSCVGLVGGLNRVFAPTPVQYPGKELGVMVMLSGDAGATFTIAYTEPADPANLSGAWSTPVAVGATWGGVTPFDQSHHYETISGDGFPHKLAVQDAGATLPVIFRSASPTTGYTLFKDGRAGQFGDTGINAAVEAMELIPHPTGPGFRLNRERLATGLGLCYSDFGPDWTPDPTRHDVTGSGWMGRGATPVTIRHGSLIHRSV